MNAAVCRGPRNWLKILSCLDHVPIGWQTCIVTKTIHRLLQQHPEVAYELYSFCYSENSMEIDAFVIYSLGVSLASHNLVQFAIPILRDAKLSDHHIRSLLNFVIRGLARNTCQLTASDLRALGDSMIQSFRTSPPLPTHRSPIQHAIVTIAARGHTSTAAEIIETIHRSSSSYLTSDFLWRVLQLIVKRREFRLATWLFSLLSSSHRAVAATWRRYLTLSLARGGANTLARQLSHSSIVPHGRFSRSEIVARTVRFKITSPSRALALKVVPIVMERPVDGPSVQLAIQILLRARRSLAAKRLFEHLRDELDSKTRTALGNMMLDGIFLLPAWRNGQQLRKVLRTLKYLVEEQGFVADRVTANIVVKAILQWTNGIDSPRLRALFDHMIRIGYPAENVREGDLPFGTSSTPAPAFPLQNLPSPISFKRHVRPMYKMFIKAFYLRGDRVAAKTIVGILKAEQVADQHRRPH
jgi:hypothetical protein